MSCLSCIHFSVAGRGSQSFIWTHARWATNKSWNKGHAIPLSVCDRQVTPVPWAWAHWTDRLVALTTSYNQLFYYRWNSIHAQINQTAGCICVVIAFTLLNDGLLPGAGESWMFRFLDSCWCKRSPALTSVRDWKSETDVIFPFLEYSLPFSLCVCVSLCTCAYRDQNTWYVFILWCYISYH